MLGAKCGGVYALVAKGSTTAAPTFAEGGTLSSTTSGATIYYTVDGSDPRYSDSAKVCDADDVPAAEEGCKVRAYAVAAGKYPSALVEK